MNVLSFSRAMRQHGWSLRRVARGCWIFGTRFPSGIGSTIVMDARTLALSNVPHAKMALHLTSQAALSARHDMRRGIA